jgi:hypothetical protein
MGKDDQCTPKYILDAVCRYGTIFLDPCWNRWCSTNPLFAFDGSSLRDGLSSWSGQLDRRPELSACHPTQQNLVLSKNENTRSFLAKCDRPIVFCNPPYSRGSLGKWVDSIVCQDLFFDQRERQASIMLFVPVSTSARWFQQAMKEFDMCLLLDKRVSYEGSKGTTPNFSSCIFLKCSTAEGDKARAIKAFQGLGTLVETIR